MFGDKQRHKEVIDQFEQTRISCDELASEVYALKEMLKTIDIAHIISTMDQFIESTSYIQHILETAEIGDADHDCESCFNPPGE